MTTWEDVAMVKHNAIKPYPSLLSKRDVLTMILLLSNDGDVSCDLVQNWLTTLSYPWIRLNAFDLIHREVDIELNSSGEYRIVIDGEELLLEKINAVWFRKFGFFRSSDVYSELSHKDMMEERAKSFLTREFAKVLELFCDALRNKKWLTNPESAGINKVKILRLALESGFLIPKTYIVNYKGFFVGKEGRLISKSVFNPTITSWGSSPRCMMYTTAIEKRDIDNMPPLFLPSMVQDMMEKYFEVRTFYIDGECYSMAIISQSDETTRMDFRCYNWERPNRCIPFRLPGREEDKVRSFMEKIGLNCGSLDFIVDKDQRFYFLEVNPTGQFGMVDFPCNYNLHKIVAERLIKMDTE